MSYVAFAEALRGRIHSIKIENKDGKIYGTFKRMAENCL